MTQNAINNTASILDVDNLRLDGNTIISTDTNGNIIIAPDGTGDIVTGTTGTANVVSMLRSAEGQWLGMDDQTDVFGIYNSTGTPEGGITANIGSLCTDTTNGEVYVKQSDSANTGWVLIGGASGQIVQITQSQSITAVSTTTTLPFDTSVPQDTEGASYMTHAHTPRSTGNLMKIEFASWGTGPGNSDFSAAIFEAGSSGALAAIGFAGSGTQNSTNPCFLFAVLAAPDTSELTFEVRFGPSGSTSSIMNGVGPATHRFSTAGTATLRVTEYLA